MKDEILVKVEGVSKRFCRSLKRSLWYGVQDVGSELFGHKGGYDQLRKNEFWAVNDVSFEVRRGECLGLIGPNGAGKSTVLKMLNGLIKPDKGCINIRGRVGALIELGAGFNPILTARENIYVNGSVLGLVRKEVDRKFDAIVDFAELEEFIDTPVQNYSSGMKVRLGFAIASQLDPDVLLIDEVLAVGDANFSFKCINQINKISQNCAVIVVSHSMPMISRMSSLAMSMRKGSIAYLGPDVGEAIQDYFATVELSSDEVELSQCLELDSILLNGEQGGNQNESIEVKFQQPLFAKLRFVVKKPIPASYVNLVFMDMEGKPVAQCLSKNSKFTVTAAGGLLEIELSIDTLLLNPGRYFLHLGVVEELPGNQLGEIFYQNRFLASLNVRGNMLSWAPVQFIAKWEKSS
jgi:lipopolysaccharide transport system ATP-binding protein